MATLKEQEEVSSSVIHSEADKLEKAILNMGENIRDLQGRLTPVLLESQIETGEERITKHIEASPFGSQLIAINNGLEGLRLSVVDILNRLDI